MYQAIGLLLLYWKMLFRGSGRHRHQQDVVPRTAPPTAPRQWAGGTDPAERLKPTAPPARQEEVQRPKRRSPYVEEAAGALDGDASALVRPYLLRYEQQQRRSELELALDGLDVPGPVWIHGVPVGVAA